MRTLNRLFLPLSMFTFVTARPPSRAMRLGCVAFVGMFAIPCVALGSSMPSDGAARPTGASADARMRSDAMARADVHDDLRLRITRFQDAWRKLWEKARTTLDGRLNPILIVENAPADPRMRRLAALQCYLATPLLTLAASEVIPRRPVLTTPDRGAICPMWSPPGGHEPSNEAESIDLALRLGDRRSARALRDNLIGAIEAAHAKHPTDDWIAGQRVRFVHDQGMPTETLVAARACRGTPGWCAMLMGLAYAQAEQVVDAEGAFRQGEALGVPRLDSLSGGCAPHEVLLLLPRTEREALTSVLCEPQSAALEQLWWLADPLWSTAGNERYVAHQARRTLIALRSVLPRDERYVWDVAATGLSLRETIIRYGWPNYTFWPGGQYELKLAAEIDFAGLGPTAAAQQVAEFSLPSRSSARRNSSIGVAPATPRVVGPRVVRLPLTVKEYSSDQTALLPSVSAIRDPLGVTNNDWSLNNPTPDMPDAWWPQEFLQLQQPLHTLPAGQLAFWRRDTSARVAHVVAVPTAVRATLDQRTDMAFLAGGASPMSTQLVARASVTPDDAMRFTGSVAPGALVLSAELLSADRRTPSYRSRFGATAPASLRDMAPNELALSTPVFLRGRSGTVAPLSLLADVVAQMASSEELERNASVTLYWESYGFPLGEPVQIALQVQSPDGKSVMQRLGALVGVSAQRDSVSMRWTESEPTRLTDAEATLRAVATHGVGLDLSALDPGAYVVRIELRTSDNRTARNERRFRVVPP